MKKIMLAKRDPRNRFKKNEEFSLDELKEIIIELRPDFFHDRIHTHNKLLLRRRLETLSAIFETLSWMIDQDKPGNHTPTYRQHPIEPMPVK